MSTFLILSCAGAVILFSITRDVMYFQFAFVVAIILGILRGVSK